MAEVDSLNGQNATLNINLHHREKQIEQLMKEIELSKTGDKGKYLTEIRNLNRSIEEFRMARDELQARLSEKQRVYERETKYVNIRCILITDHVQITVLFTHLSKPTCCIRRTRHSASLQRFSIALRGVNSNSN
eukprot:TRINITY_DN1632_c0_g1_i1.p1 TRINITY_DN1632_c0_g1~~TRINITY_DN1632_c0_g1_i1.p1  ORF type:complete len:134 (+),score=15.13 TRINITY_DN1632_c0_g1_i1:117-518(+)